MAFFLALVLAALAPSGMAASCLAGSQDAQFPEPSVPTAQAALTQEQGWMQSNWPGYHNGVALGGGFVVENWMFFRHTGVNNPATLQLLPDTKFDNWLWSQELLKGERETAYATMDCHLKQFYSDADLDAFADFGITSVRLPVGYWIFDDPSLYPGDEWVARPGESEKFNTYGVNPDGFITPGTSVLSDLVVRLHNRNMKVLIDMHALPGCSSPHQSYAGMWCDPVAPNTWGGAAHDGVSGGHTNRRADDGKTWMDVARKIALERVVPWIKFMEGYAPGAIIGYELVNEPDIASSDASADAVRALTLELGKDVVDCLGDFAGKVFVGVSTAAKNYPSSAVGADYKKLYGSLKHNFVTDIHHYFYWCGCIDYGSNTFSLECACDANLPGTPHASEDVDWASWMGTGVFDEGWGFYVGEWSAGSGPAHKCQHGVPTHEQAKSMWQAQKLGFLNQYLHYKGLDASGPSSFVGDFYWNGRMGYNWNPDPSVCTGSSSATHYADFKSWDWSLLRLIKLGLAQPLSQLGFSPEGLAAQKAGTCSGTIPVNCQGGAAAPLAPAGGQPGMGAAPPGGQPGMAPAPAPVPAPAPAGQWTAGCEWIPKDNCHDTNEYACKCRSQNPSGPCTPCGPGGAGSQPKVAVVARLHADSGPITGEVSQHSWLPTAVVFAAAALGIFLAVVLSHVSSSCRRAAAAEHPRSSGGARGAEDDGAEPLVAADLIFRHC